MMSTEKHSLQNRLATILKLSHTQDRDYLADILDHLLSIDDSNDVTEYLSSFVINVSNVRNGNDREDLQSFAEDLRRYKLGDYRSGSQAIIGNESENGNQTNRKPDVTTALTSKRILDEGAVQREMIRSLELEARGKNRKDQESLRKKKADDEKRRERETCEKNVKMKNSTTGKKEKNSRGKSAKAESILFGSHKDHGITEETAANVEHINDGNYVSSNLINKQSSFTIINSKPIKGKATIICGCYGNKHKPLTNCLHCGRISCESEGYDYCPFCSYRIDQIFPNGNSNTKYNSALAHKERLLEYDRHSSSRTHVLDDQEDYFATSTSMWSTAEEQKSAQKLENERKQKLQKQKQTLRINF